MLRVNARAAEAVANREHLTLVLGLWGADTSWTIPGSLLLIPAEETPLEHAEALAIANRLDLAAARVELGD